MLMLDFLTQVYLSYDIWYFALETMLHRHKYTSEKEKLNK